MNILQRYIAKWNLAFFFIQRVGAGLKPAPTGLEKLKSFQVEQEHTPGFLPAYFFADFLPPVLEYFIDFFHVHQLQRLAGADFHANRIVHKSAPVAFQGDLPVRPGVDHSVGTEHRAGPAGDAAVLLDNHQVRLGFPGQGAGQTGIDAGGV
jgi:hypothetical protein